MLQKPKLHIILLRITSVNIIYHTSGIKMQRTDLFGTFPYLTKSDEMVHLMIREMKTIVKWLAITQQLYQNSMKNLKIL